MKVGSAVQVGMSCCRTVLKLTGCESLMPMMAVSISNPEGCANLFAYSIGSIQTMKRTFLFSWIVLAVLRRSDRSTPTLSLAL